MQQSTLWTLLLSLLAFTEQAYQAALAFSGVAIHHMCTQAALLPEPIDAVVGFALHSLGLHHLGLDHFTTFALICMAAWAVQQSYPGIQYVHWGDIWRSFTRAVVTRPRRWLRRHPRCDLVVSGIGSALTCLAVAGVGILLVSNSLQPGHLATMPARPLHLQQPDVSIWHIAQPVAVQKMTFDSHIYGTPHEHALESALDAAEPQADRQFALLEDNLLKALPTGPVQPELYPEPAVALTDLQLHEDQESTLDTAGKSTHTALLHGQQQPQTFATDALGATNCSWILPTRATFDSFATGVMLAAVEPPIYQTTDAHILNKQPPPFSLQASSPSMRPQPFPLAATSQPIAIAAVAWDTSAHLESVQVNSKAVAVLPATAPMQPVSFDTTKHYMPIQLNPQRLLASATAAVPDAILTATAPMQLAASDDGQGRMALQLDTQQHVIPMTSSAKGMCQLKERLDWSSKAYSNTSLLASKPGVAVKGNVGSPSQSVSSGYIHSAQEAIYQLATMIKWAQSLLLTTGPLNKLLQQSDVVPILHKLMAELFFTVLLASGGCYVIWYAQHLWGTRRAALPAVVGLKHRQEAPEDFKHELLPQQTSWQIPAQLFSSYFQIPEPDSPPADLPHPLVDAESILPKQAAALSEAANHSTAAPHTPSPHAAAVKKPHKLDAIPETDVASVEDDVQMGSSFTEAAAEEEQPSDGTTVSEEGGMQQSVDQARTPQLQDEQRSSVPEVQQQQHSSVGFTNSTSAGAFSVQHADQNQGALDMQHGAADVVTEFSYRELQQPADVGFVQPAAVCSVQQAAESEEADSRVSSEAASKMDSEDGHSSTAAQVDQTSTYNVSFPHATEASGVSMFAPVEVAKLPEHSVHKTGLPDVTYTGHSGGVQSSNATHEVQLLAAKNARRNNKGSWLKRRVCCLCPATK